MAFSLGLVGFVALSLIQVPQARAADAKGWDSYALLTGVPSRVQRVEEVPAPAGSLVMAATYGVQLRNVEVIYGNLELQKVRVELIASQPTAITSNKRIFVLVQIADDGSLVVRRWGGITQIICIQSELVDDLGIQEDFYEFGMLEGSRCTNAEWHR